MKTPVMIVLLVGACALSTSSARAHCDAVDGPVATAALKAPDTKNVNLILPYAPAEAEPEFTAAFEQALIVRSSVTSSGSTSQRRAGAMLSNGVIAGISTSPSQ